MHLHHRLFVYKSRVSTGIVKKQSRVVTSTQLAANSASLLCISARFKMMEAQGVAHRISTLDLNAGSKGSRYTAP